MPGTEEPAVVTDADRQEQDRHYAAYLLRCKNIHEYKSNIICGGLLTWPNGVAIETGTTIQFANKGQWFTGKWIIQMVRFHVSDNKFITEIEFRKCIVEGTTEPQQLK